MFADLEDTNKLDELLYSDAPAVKVHPFEAKGLGKAPFTMSHMDEGRCSCDFCGTSLKYLYNVRSAEGNMFIVGSECIKKVSDQNLIRVVKMHEKKRRHLAKQAKLRKTIESFKAEYPEVVEWLVCNQVQNNFARSLSQALNQYGSLTSGQLNAVYKNLGTHHGEPSPDEVDMSAAVEKYTAEHEDIVMWLKDQQESNSFAASVLSQLNQKGYLSSGQEKAILRKVEEQRSVISFEKESFNKLSELFANAKRSGLKRPILRVQSLKFSAAPDNGRNAGYLYVKNNGCYIGKISDEGAFSKGWDCTPEDSALIADISNNPYEQAIIHGKKTGECSCCGRELTKAESIALGIGPVCKDKWGL